MERRTHSLLLLCTLVLMGAGPASAAAQEEPPPQGTPPAEPPADRLVPGSLLHAPGAVAPGGRIVLSTRGIQRPARIQQFTGGQWIPRALPITAAGQHVGFAAPLAAGTVRLRARGADGGLTPERSVRVRPLVLAAVGDVNLGNGPGSQIDRFGSAWPWASVGPRLRRADIAVANLESAVSTRGAPVEKAFVFRGRPAALRAAARTGGLDVVSLANNHSGDYGRAALLDTLRHSRAAGIVPVGAGASEASAYRPQVVTKLGLRVAFVGFSDIGPFEFRATGRTPGSAWAFPARVARSVRAARRQGDVVVAMFHWGIERDRAENARQRGLARTALAAGAHAVIGHHPHVLQPIRRPPGRIVAYSLGNFVFSANSPGTGDTGILEVSLRARRVLAHRFVRARIVASRPVLR